MLTSSLKRCEMVPLKHTQSEQPIFLPQYKIHEEKGCLSKPWKKNTQICGLSFLPNMKYKTILQNPLSLQCIPGPSDNGVPNFVSIRLVGEGNPRIRCGGRGQMGCPPALGIWGRTFWLVDGSFILIWEAPLASGYSP